MREGVSPSRRPLALALALSSAGFLGLAVSDVLEPLSIAAGIPPTRVGILNVFVAGMAIVLSIWAAVLVRQTAATDWSPWIFALRAYAAEHGQQIQARTDGLHFDALRDHQRYHIHVDPDGLMEVLWARPAQQGLAMVRVDERPGFAERWFVLPGGKGWELLAEVPVAARAIQEDAHLGHLVDRFFMREQAMHVLHDLTGLHVLSRTPVAHVVEQRLREAVEIARLLRIANG